MKILRLTTLLDFGGQEKKYLSFTEKPELLQNQYVFAAIGYGGNAEKVLRVRGFEVHVLNRNFTIKNISNIFAIYRLIRKVKPDLIHTAAAEANFHGIIAAKLAGVRTIIGEEIGIPNHSKIARRIFRQIYKRANKVICVSESVKKHLIAIGEIPPEKGTLLYNPVSIPTPYNRQDSGKFEIVYVGRLEIVKNVEVLIKAFSKIQHEDVQLTIVGDGRERENLEKLVKENNLTNKVSFIGFSNEPSKYVSSADLYVLPSYSEGFGIAAVEAMFLKVPVLCSNVGGIPEFVKDGINGWLFDPNDKKGLVDKLNGIIDMDSDERIAIGKRGFEDVVDKFTVSNYIFNLESFYKQVH